MNRISAALLVSAMMLATPANAASPFDGTWKGDPTSTKMEAKPEEFSVRNGVYDCKTCLPHYSVKADGAFHAVKDRPYWDEIAVKVVDPKTVSYKFRKGGKLIAENEQTVSADGNTLTNKATNTNNATGSKVDMTTSLARVGAPVSGAHAVSGAWKQDNMATAISDNAITMTIKLDGDRLHLVTGVGETLDAKIGGDYVPNVGDPGKTVTRAEQPAPNVLKLTDMRQGKVVQVATYTLNADGTTMEGAWTDPRDGSKGSFLIRKQ